MITSKKLMARHMISKILKTQRKGLEGVQKCDILPIKERWFKIKWRRKGRVYNSFKYCFNSFKY